MSLHFSILGHDFYAEDLSETLKQWLCEKWRFNYACEPQFPSFYLEGMSEHPSDFPSGTFDTITLPNQTLPVLKQDPVFFLGTQETGVRLLLGESVFSMKVWGNSRTVYVYLQVALSECLRACGWLPLHASVALKDAKATAFSADSGTGKTTTLLRALEAGWQILAEDFVWLEPASLSLYGWDHGVRLLPDTLEAFRHLYPDSSYPLDAMGKAFVPFESLGGVRRKAVTLSRLAWLVRDETQVSGWQVLSKRATALQLWNATGLALSEQARQKSSAAISKIAQNVHSEYLMLGYSKLMF